MSTIALWADEVIVSNNLLVRCLIQGRCIDLHPSHLQPGTTVQRSGDAGMVVVPVWLARAMALA